MFKFKNRKKDFRIQFVRSKSFKKFDPKTDDADEFDDLYAQYLKDKTDFSIKELKKLKMLGWW